jgi:hypothetical protein
MQCRVGLVERMMVRWNRRVVMVAKTKRCAIEERRLGNDLSPLSSEPSGELHVLGLDGNSLGVNGTEVGIYIEGEGREITLAIEIEKRWELKPDVPSNKLTR